MTLLTRLLSQRLPKSDSQRLVMITGARQTGKTTLARTLYPDLRYLSLDEVETRLSLRQLPTRSWASTVGNTVLDEAQKEPSIFEKIKFAFDERTIQFSVLLGSSQILMLTRVRETLAGRVFIYELFPLMLSELTRATNSLRTPLLDTLLHEPGRADELLSSLPATLLGHDAHALNQHVDYSLSWGGMPGLLTLDERERRDWMNSYSNTYLERDLSDIARLDDLLPFRRFQRLAALRSAQLLSYADLARDADVSAGTARNYLNYLMLSYQAFLLQPYFSNRGKSLVKAPKLYWLDAGIWRHQSGFVGEVTGQLFETWVIGECYKWVKTTQSPAELWFYRTQSGLEVDLLITTASGVWGVEVKASRVAEETQAKSLKRLAQEFGDQWRGGLIVYQGEMIRQLAENLWAMPAGRLLG